MESQVRNKNHGIKIKDLLMVYIDTHFSWLKSNLHIDYMFTLK